MLDLAWEHTRVPPDKLKEIAERRRGDVWGFQPNLLQHWSRKSSDGGREGCCTEDEIFKFLLKISVVKLNYF